VAEKETDVLVEVTHNYRVHLVPESVLENADALRMPDGTFLNLKKTGVEHDLTRIPHRHRLIGTTSDFEVCGILPTLKIAEAPESIQKPN
jgi:hypothetical protein